MSEDQFTVRAKMLFSNVDFHESFEETLSTVNSGNFKTYSIEFVRAMHALHNAVPKLSQTGHNPPDLITIKNETGLLGRTMACTPQGRNKSALYYDFKYLNESEGVYKVIKINCEYHLKINFDNTGEKIHRDNYNRAYFGLPLIDGKKRIALAFLGKHYSE